MLTAVKKPLIIGLVGLIGSGKDTVADFLVSNENFCRASFAGALKDAVSAVFGWDRELLEGRTKEARAWREQVDEWWSKRLGRVITPRWILQYWGTEVCRRGFHDDIWVASIENQLRNSNQHVVITDCRFPNEIQVIRNQGGLVMRVVRGPEPQWFETAIKANLGDQQAKETMLETVHQSEWAWVGSKVDFVIDNNGTIEQLHQQVKNLVQSRLASMVD